ncbi:MAG: TIR domain-containing protein [Nitrospira sp.]|nr:TIR domain-containing protein [Nitrospira sp.]
MKHPNAIRAEVGQLIQSCDRVRVRLDAATAELRKREQDMEPKRFRWWTESAAWETVNTLLREDLAILTRLRDLAARKRPISKPTLERCRALIGDVGRSAFDLAERFPSIMMRQSLPASQSLAHDKAVLRALTRTHWDLVDNLSKMPDAVYAEVKDHIESLTRSLEDVGWLFVIFICYARKDAAFLNDLFRLSQPRLKDDHVVLWWDDKPFEKKRSRYWWQRKIIGASEWHKELMNHIDDVDLGIVLVSKPFFASTYIKNNELPRMVKKRKKEGMRIFPIILEGCNWKKEDWLKATQWLPGRGRTVQRDYYTEPDLKRLYADEFVPEIRVIIDELSDPEKAIRP